MPDVTPTDAPRFRIGLFLQPIHPPEESPAVTLEDDLALIAHLDRLGYDEAWIGEHHSTGWETIASPAVFIASAAARTRAIRLGSETEPFDHEGEGFALRQAVLQVRPWTRPHPDEDRRVLARSRRKLLQP